MQQSLKSVSQTTFVIFARLMGSRLDILDSGVRRPTRILDGRDHEDSTTMFRRLGQIFARRNSRSTMPHSGGRKLQGEPLEGRIVLTAWTNDALPADVNADEVVAPLDALLVINELNAREFSDPTTGGLPEFRPEGADFLDVTDNGVVAPLDALFVINELSSANVIEFTIAENAVDDAVVGTIEAPGGISEDTIFELEKSSTLTADERSIYQLKPDDHYLGAADASVVLIEYLDLACPICGLYHPLIQEALDNFDGDIAVVSRHLPLTSIHPNARSAAVAAEAAGRQGKFDEMADLLFTRRLSTDWDDAVNPLGFYLNFAEELNLDIAKFQADFNDPALVDRVNRDGNDAFNTLGFSGTPSFVLNDVAVDLPGLTQANVNQMFQDAIDAVESPFKIDRFTGQIRVRDASRLDFEAQSSYNLRVQVNGVIQEIRINVTDVPGV